MPLRGGSGSTLLRPLLARLLDVLRLSWLILGCTLLVAFSLEGLYRAQGALRALVRPQTAPVHPNAEVPWWSEWERRDRGVNGPSRYDPYRGWWALPYSAPFVHVDSAGARWTLPQGPTRPGTPRILYLGGSVMWGYTVPDSLTIPSLVAAKAEAAGLGPWSSVNLAQPSANTTQGLITLLLELRAGRRPDVVVSLDGNNDVLAALEERRPGAAFGEADLARRSAVGWRGFLANVAGLARYSLLLQRLGRALPARLSADSVPDCEAVSAYYTRLVQTAEQLGAANHFATLYLWQPHLATTGKKLNAYERSIPVEAPLAGFMRQCTGMVEGRLAGDSGFVTLTGLYNGDTAAVFLDPYGHLTAEGNARVADVIVERLAHLLRRPDRGL